MIYILDGKSSRVTGRTLTDTSAWANSCIIDGDLVQAVKNDRLLTFPTILGTGERLFPPAGRPPAYLEVLSAEQSGAAVLTRYGRARRQPAGLV